MRIVSNIVNARAIEFGLNLSEAYVFDYLYDAPAWAEPITWDGKTWYWVARQKTMEDLPLLSKSRSTDTVYRHYKNLKEKGLVFLMKVGDKDCIRITEKGKLWKFGKISEPAEKFPTYNSNNLSNTNREYLSEKFPSVGKISEPADVGVDLPPEELRIKIALNDANLYFKQWPAMKDTLLERVRIKLDDDQFYLELENWIRHNSKNGILMQDIPGYISKSFGLWLSRAKSFQQNRQASKSGQYKPTYGETKYSPSPYPYVEAGKDFRPAPKTGTKRLGETVSLSDALNSQKRELKKP